MAFRFKRNLSHTGFSGEHIPWIGGPMGGIASKPNSFAYQIVVFLAVLLSIIMGLLN